MQIFIGPPISLIKERIKINIGDSNSSQIEITQFTTAEEICNRLAEKHTIAGLDSSKLSLYVLVQNSKKIIGEGKLLRLLSPNNLILELHRTLLEQKIIHEFYALPLQLYEKINTPVIALDYNEKFFKESKWERVGELMKYSEKLGETDPKKQHIYTKKTCYLGKDTLYYISKDSIFHYFY